MDPAIGLAAVSEALSNALPGSQGVIHVSTGTAVILTSKGLIEADGKVMRVKGTGNPVVVGTGYGDATYTGGTIYGTGPVLVHLGQSKITTPDLTQGALIQANEFLLQAERPAGVSWDGCVHIKAGITY
jgi:hypothetical protein